MNLSNVSTEELLDEVFRRHECVAMSLCRRDENKQIQAFHHYRGDLHLLLAEAELLKDEIMEGHRENLKNSRRNIPMPGRPKL